MRSGYGPIYSCLTTAISLCFGLLLSVNAQSLDETWQLQVAGQTARANADGSFVVPNIRSEPQSALIQTNPNAPTLPHFSRLIGYKSDGQKLRYVYSAPFEIKPGTTIEVAPGDLTFSDSLPIMVTGIQVTAAETSLAGIGETTQLQVLANFSDGSLQDVTQASTKTVYQSSDPAIATISSDGLVTAQAAGEFYASAIQSGMTASIALSVQATPAPKDLVGFVYGPTQQPLADALVHIPGTQRVVSTDSQGRYEFPALPAAMQSPKVRIISGLGNRRIGETQPLTSPFPVIDGGILNGQTVDQILALPCTDPDQDCLPDAIEIQLGLDPNNNDSDGNGILDGMEDHDGDLLVNRLEVHLGTDPNRRDSDTDGLSDGDEILRYRSIPSLADSDGDGRLDGAQDSDNDGLLDIAEDANGNYLVDAGETDPQKADTDGDGVNDPQELEDETSPTNEYAFEPRALSHFKFDSALYLGEQNQVPLQNIGNSQVASFPPLGRNAFRSQAGTRLIYRVVEANNHKNINLIRGSIKFWFKPNWNSGEQGNPFGSRLLEIGRFSATGQGNDGWWGLFLNSDRTKLTFASQGPNSSLWERYIEAVDLNFQAGQWYQIELTYGPRITYRYADKDPAYEQRYSNSYLFINGQREGIGLGVNPALLPNEAAINEGFAIGSQHDGTLIADASFDELQTYNYPLHTWNDRIMTDRNWQARPDPDSGSIFLERRFPTTPLPAIPVDIFRRVTGTSNWGQAIVSDYTFPIYQDSTVTPGIAYDYRIWDTEATDFSGLNKIVLQQHINAAIDLPPMHTRGKVILLVEDSISTPLASEISLFKSNLVGDGWEISSHQVSRQNDENLALNNSSINVIKGLIDLDIEATKTNVVLILGHVPVPMSGFHAADGHDNQPQNRPDHRGAWTADAFYGSTNLNHWTDVGPTVIDNLDSPQNSNFPGDGKFDQDRLPQPFGVAVGRIDFARMDSFTNAPYLPGYPNNTPRSVEIELLRQYIKKNDRYRKGELKFENRMAAFRGFGQNRDSATGLYNALNLSANLFGLDDQRTINTRGYSSSVPYLFSFYEMNSFNTGTGLAWEHLNASQTYSYRTTDLSDPNNEPPLGFHLLYGSYFGDWNLKVDNWLKAVLATPNAGLAALYYFPDKWRLERMGLGAPIASGMAEFNDTTKYINYGIFPNGAIVPFYNEVLAPPRMLSILGDPTLRAHILPPPHSPIATGQGRSVRLTWEAPSVSDVAYHVYRSTNGLDGPFTRISNFATVTETEFLDNFAPTGPKTYSIRAAKRHVSGSGSYINLSQAAFVTAE